MAISQLFASKSMAEHIVRGVIGTAAFAAAGWSLEFSGAAAILGAVAFTIAGLIALRGCPICWSIGLFNTLLNTTLRSNACKACEDITLRQH